MIMTLFPIVYKNFSIEGGGNFIRTIPSIALENKNKIIGLVILIAGAIFVRFFYVLNRSLRLLEKRIKKLEQKMKEDLKESDESNKQLVKRIEKPESPKNGLVILNMSEVIEKINGLDVEVCRLIKAIDQLFSLQEKEISYESVQVSEEELNKRRKLDSSNFECRINTCQIDLPIKLKEFESAGKGHLNPSPRHRSPLPSGWLNPQHGENIEEAQFLRGSEQDDSLFIQINSHELLDKLDECDKEEEK
jgi:hypothetical protein